MIYTQKQVKLLTRLIKGKIELLRDKTKYVNIRPPKKAPQDEGDGYFTWWCGYDIKDKENLSGKDESSGAVIIYLDNKTGEFEINDFKTKNICGMLDGIEGVLLDEGGRK